VSLGDTGLTSLSIAEATRCYMKGLRRTLRAEFAPGEFTRRLSGVEVGKLDRTRAVKMERILPIESCNYGSLAIVRPTGKVWKLRNVGSLVLSGAGMRSSDSRFITIAEACKRLGIAPNTLRSWGAGGKIQEYRHPINNYRLYSLDDVDRLAELLNRPIKVGRGFGGVRSD
jgi:hypothetical protein